jgi:hypothetical protein
MLYKILKTAITYNYFTADDMKNKLNIFLLYNQLTDEQYSELMNLVAPHITPTNTNSSTSPSDSTTTN